MLSEQNRALAVAISESAVWAHGVSWWAEQNPNAVNALMNAAREQGIREERMRAIAVLRPFADLYAVSEQRLTWCDFTVKVRDLRAASSYITQAQGE